MISLSCPICEQLVEVSTPIQLEQYCFNCHRDLSIYFAKAIVVEKYTQISVSQLNALSAMLDNAIHESLTPQERLEILKEMKKIVFDWEGV